MIRKLYLAARVVLAMPAVRTAIAFGAVTFGLGRLGELVDEHRQTLQQLTGAATDKRAELRHLQTETAIAREELRQAVKDHDLERATHAPDPERAPATGSDSGSDNGAVSEPAAAAGAVLAGGADEYDDQS